MLLFFINRKLFALLCLFVLLSCKNNRNKDKILPVIPICNQHLFIEKYLIAGGGGWGGDLLSAYLTDSTNFRNYLFTYDDAHESISIDCKEMDSVIVYKYMQDTATLKFKIVNTTAYNVLDLKKKNICE